MNLGFKGGFSFFGREYAPHPFEMIWANEINEHACGTYRQNLGQEVHIGDICQKMDGLPKSADVVIGEFPCQDISVNGKGTGIKGERIGLYRAMVETVAKVRSKIFVAENVKGLLMRKHAQDLEQILHDFKNLGYRVRYKLHSVADYGVPQTRERVVITGTRNDMGDFDHPEGLLKPSEHITAKQALHDLVSVEEDRAINHIWSRAGKS